jgi:hypothetical protein
MSGFLLRLSDKGPGRVLRTPGRDRLWLAGDAREGHLLPPLGGGAAGCHRAFSSGSYSASHLVSINNHFCGAGTGTAETPAARLESVTGVPIAEPGHGGVFASFWCSSSHCSRTYSTRQLAIRPGHIMVTKSHVTVPLAACSLAATFRRGQIRPAGAESAGVPPRAGQLARGSRLRCPPEKVRHRARKGTHDAETPAPGSVVMCVAVRTAPRVMIAGAKPANLAGRRRRASHDGPRGGSRVRPGTAVSLYLGYEH